MPFLLGAGPLPLGSGLLADVSYWLLVMVGYAATASLGWWVARRGFALWGTTFLVVVYTVMPRMVMTPTAETSTVVNEKPLAILAMFALGLGLGVAEGRADRRIVLVPAALLWAGVLISPWNLLNPALTWLSAGGAFFLLARRWRRGRTALLALLSLLGVSSVFLLIPGVGAPNAIQYEHLGRPYGVFGNPIVAADALAFLGTATLASLWAERPWRPWVTAVATAVFAAVLFAAVVMTGSKTGLLLVLVVVAATVLGFFPVGRRPVRPRTMALLGGGGAVLFVLCQPLAERVLGRAATIELGGDSIMARVVGWREGLLTVLERPLGGDRVAIRFGPADLRSFENLFLDLGSRLGWLPLASLVVLLVLVWRQGTHSARMGVLLAVCAGLTAATYFHPAVMVLGFVAMGVLDSRPRGPKHAHSPGAPAAAVSSDMPAVAGETTAESGAA